MENILPQWGREGGYPVLPFLAMAHPGKERRVKPLFFGLLESDREKIHGFQAMLFPCEKGLESIVPCQNANSWCGIMDTFC
jgi:hypothetical protein